MSTISQMLQDMNEKFDEETPKQLVDRMLEFNKKKKKLKSNNSSSPHKTYTISSPSRASLPASKTFSLNEIRKNDTRVINKSDLSLENPNVSPASVNQFEAVSQEIDSQLMQLLDGGNNSTLIGTDKSIDKSVNKTSQHHKSKRLIIIFLIFFKYIINNFVKNL